MSFRDGVWNGWYTIAGKEKRNMAINLTFKYGSFRGSGVDDVGGYVDVTGTFNDKPPYNAEFQLKFHSGEVVEFSGWREKEKNGIFGSFKGLLGGGSFAIYPSNNPGKLDMDQMASKANDTMIKTLKDMGFPAGLCSEAPLHSHDLESAVDWITRQLSAPAPASQAAAPAPAGSDEAIATLALMGFSNEKAKLALAATNNDVERAVEWLFEHAT